MSRMKSHAVDAISYAMQEEKILASTEAQRKYEQMQKIIEQMAFEEKSKVLTDVKQIEKAKEEARKAIEQHKKQIEECEALENELSSIPFSIGDVAFHKEYGNVIIKGYELSKDMKSFTGYAVVSKGGEFRVAKNTILPYSETTKVLYGNK
jgi:TolA-binding protein